MNRPTTSDPPTEFELETWLREASSLITCTGCFGTGQRYRHNRERDSGRWELCDRCQGAARCEAEPHVMRLIAEVRRLRSEVADRRRWFDDQWAECHDGSEQGCCKAHED